MFSKACKYAVKATIYIAVQSGQNTRTSLKDISAKIDSPEAFTAKVLQVLVKNQVIESLKGPLGGFFISNEAAKLITLSHVVYLIDGTETFNSCGLGLKECSECRPCPMHHKFQRIRSELKEMIEKTTIYELVLKVGEGESFLM
ncbi:transcriptional regulator [Solitalea longa]|uniref:Transcriptional regulator n=1 Tax=Solitalea longa TaxID=2079460 RepID=A0A2S5A1S6_9SPHI|nr:Rrf2 family transcriptional regulator [Solitalea longa]POY36526.1 transcriptional regulator [Solitalea longa]